AVHLEAIQDVQTLILLVFGPEHVEDQCGVAASLDCAFKFPRRLLEFKSAIHGIQQFLERRHSSFDAGQCSYDQALTEAYLTSRHWSSNRQNPAQSAVFDYLDNIKKVHVRQVAG